MKRALVVIACLAAAGCATPNTIRPQIGSADTAAEADKEAQYAIQSQLADAGRIEDVAFRLEKANNDLCPVHRSRVGIAVTNAEEFKNPIHDVAVRTLHLGESLTVIHVIPESPAALAGVQVGDELVSFDGAAVASGAKAQERFTKELAEALDKTPSKVTVAVRRNGELKTLKVAPVPTCAYDVVIANTPELNAYADGKHVYVTRPMLKLAANDQELALVVAHELAHDARGHITAKTRNSVLAGIGGATLDVLAAAGGVNTQGAFTKAAMQAGANYSSPEFEAEADYVGMYFLARAGYPTDGVENFWRKMAVENPTSIFIKTSHPATPSRYLAIAATTKEIASKEGSGQALLPNEKGK